MTRSVPRNGPGRRGFLFRMRRGSLVPLLILVVIAAVLLRVIPRSAARANFEGWHADLQARVFADALEVGVASPGWAALGVMRTTSL